MRPPSTTKIEQGDCGAKLWSNLRCRELTGIFDVLSVGRPQGVHLVLALLARHENQMSSRRRNHPQATPLQAKVVFFPSLALQANLGFIRPKYVGPRTDKNVEITVTLHAGE